MKMRIVFDKDRAEEVLVPLFVGGIALGGYLIGVGVGTSANELANSEIIAEGKLFQAWFHDHPVGVPYEVYAITPEDVPELKHPLYYQLAVDDVDTFKGWKAET